MTDMYAMFPKILEHHHVEIGLLCVSYYYWQVYIFRILFTRHVFHVFIAFKLLLTTTCEQHQGAFMHATYS